MLRSRMMLILLAATVVLLALCAPAPVLAQEPAACISSAPMLLPAGLACNFALQINICGDPNRVERVFTDKNGNVVRLLSAGKGNTLTFANQASGKALTTRANGSVFKTIINPDGTQTVSGNGHTVLIMFPTDVPAGPSTTLYVGKMVYTVDTVGNFTFVSASGGQTDICAALQ